MGLGRGTALPAGLTRPGAVQAIEPATTPETIRCRCREVTPHKHARRLNRPAAHHHRRAGALGGISRARAVHPPSSCALALARLEAGIIAWVSRGPAARLETHHGRLGRPLAGVGVEFRIDRDPALPQSVTLLPRGGAGAHRPRLLARQSNDGVGARLEVGPPQRMTGTRPTSSPPSSAAQRDDRGQLTSKKRRSASRTISEGVVSS
jgi:hypothetical protein